MSCCFPLKKHDHCQDGRNHLAIAWYQSAVLQLHHTCARFQNILCLVVFTGNDLSLHMVDLVKVFHSPSLHTEPGAGIYYAKFDLPVR